MAQQPETGRYRKDVDAGRTGDKVAHPDPAAAPLETDAETGGAATGKRQLRETARQQRTAHQRAARRLTPEAQAGLWGLGATVVLVAAGVLAAVASLSALP